MSKEDFKPGDIALEWWTSLQRDPTREHVAARKGDPGALARLRRASSPVDALCEEQAINLARRLGVKSNDHFQLARIGALAAVLAHVKPPRNEDEKGPPIHIARQLGPPPKKEEPGAMSALRFRRLMAANTADDLMREMRTAVKLLKGTANIKDLADAMYYWNDRTRVTWTYNYWGAGHSDPASTSKQILKDIDTEEAAS